MPEIRDAWRTVFERGRAFHIIAIALGRFAMIVAVTGLAREARAIAQPGVRTVVRGSQGHSLESRLEMAVEGGAEAVVSVGICGALAPDLKVGDCIVATEIVFEGYRLVANFEWLHALLNRLPQARPAAIAGSDFIVASAADKKRLYEQTHASAVDMESHVAARLSLKRGLPFGALRIVSDESGETLPAAALVSTSATGRVVLGKVARSILAEPTQIPALIRTARNAEKAFRALFRCSRVLSLPRPELGELALDVG